MTFAMKPRFESLENKVLLSHGVTDHVHARLTIEIEGHEEHIPANIGLGTGHYNPHTHAVTHDSSAGHTADEETDSGGIIHIGEGGPAGLSGQVRYVTLEDFFDVWREAEGTVVNNVDALFSKDEIMGHVVDRHHELTMYVNGVENDEFEKYIPHDLDDISIVYERLSWAWQNYDQPLDVSDDGIVTPRDALHIINDINDHGARQTTPEEKPEAYYDVNGDDFVTAVDVLMIIQHLNAAAR